MGFFTSDLEADGPVTQREGRALDDGDGYRAHKARELALRAFELAGAGDDAGARDAVSGAVALLPWLADADAARVRRWVGEALVRLGAFDAARTHLRAAVRLAEAVGDRRGAAAARYAYGCARLAQA